MSIFLNKDKWNLNNFMNLSKAIDTHVNDGGYLASTGFGFTQISIAALMEIVGQKIRFFHIYSLNISI